MPERDPLSRIPFLYHFTDRRNLPLIRHHGGNLDATMQTLQRAARKSDAREYIGAILSGDRQPETDWGAEYRRMVVSL